MEAEQKIEQITELVSNRFNTFGGGKKSSWGNPIAAALEDKPLVFAAGVSVRDVVEFVVFYAGVIEKTTSGTPLS